MADRPRAGRVGHRPRGALRVGDVRRRLREGPRVLVRAGSTGPAGHRRGPGELLLLADRGPESKYQGNQVLRQQRSEEDFVGGDAAGGVRALARGDVVRAGQAGDRPGGVRSPNVSEPHPTLVVFADGDVLPGRPDRAASGGKIRGSPWSKWPRRPTDWRRRSGTGTGTRMLS